MNDSILSPQDDTRDIFLDGIVARNRALDGDIVVVQVLPQDQWKVDKHSLVQLSVSVILRYSGAEGFFCFQAGEVRF